MIMYKKVYLMLFNRMSYVMEQIEKTYSKVDDVEIKKSLTKIMDYLIEAQCTAEDVIINSEEDIE